MSIVDKKVLSVKEGIELCIKNNLPGAEGQLKSFIKNKKLGKNQIVKLQGNLESLFQKAIVTGGGKSGECILSEPKETATKRITGNSTNGRKPSEEDETLKEYFFAELVRRIGHRKDGWSETYNLWGRDWINQFSVSDMEWGKFETKLKETLGSNEKLDETMINEIYRNIKDNLKKDNRSLAIKLIERLEKEERIETEIEFFQAIAKGSYVEAMLKKDIEENERIDYHNEIPESMQIRIAKEITEKLLPFQMSYQRYKVVAAFPQFGTPEERKAIQAIGEWLIDEYSIDYMYSRIRIFVIEPESKQEISKKEAEKAFINRIINKTNTRMNRKDYKNTHKFQNAFFRLSMFLLLDMKNVKGLKEIILAEKKKINNAVSECVFQYAMKYGEKYEPEERVIVGFGEYSLEPVKREIAENLKGHDLTNLFDDKQQGVEEVKEVKPVSGLVEDIAWMDRILAAKKSGNNKIVTPTKLKSKAKKPIKTEATLQTIDIEAILNEPEPVKEEKKQYNRVFGSTFVIRNNIEMKEFAINE